MSGSDNQHVVQPANFAFTAENKAEADRVIAKYPAGRQASAVLPLLYIAQKQEGWVPRAAMDHIAEMLDMAPIRVYEVATFYTMFHLQPVGKYHLQVCRTTPCWLRGADQMTETCKKKLGIGLKETTKDGLFSLIEVECLGGCVERAGGADQRRLLRGPRSEEAGVDPRRARRRPRAAVRLAERPQGRRAGRRPLHAQRHSAPKSKAPRWRAGRVTRSC